jgi:putative FmdB family regulatory protein
MAPMYDFYCAKCNESEEHFFGFADKQEVTCVECGANMTKTIFPVGVVFKGGGWGGQ